MDRKEVVKVWRPRKRTSKVDKRRFLAEVQKNAQFSHENIVNVYEADILDDEIYYCRMEYVRGDTLKEYLKKEIDFSLRYIIINKILEVMEGVYRRGLYHGDLHSKNIIINIKSNEILKIIDFGTSIFFEDGKIA